VQQAQAQQLADKLEAHHAGHGEEPKDHTVASYLMKWAVMRERRDLPRPANWMMNAWQDIAPGDSMPEFQKTAWSVR